MPTRIELNNNLTSILTPVIEVSQHLQANQMMLDYVDQQVAASGSTDLSNYYTKAQIDVIDSLKADLVGGKVPLSQLPTGLTSSDTYVTGGTYNNGTGIATFRNNTGGTFNISGFNTGVISGTTDTYISGGTYSGGTLILRNNTGGTITVSGFATGSTVPTLEQVTTAGNTSTNSIDVVGNHNKRIRLISDINPTSYINMGMSLGEPLFTIGYMGGSTSFLSVSSSATTLNLPTNSGTIPVSVNGQYANYFGNITLTGFSTANTYVTGGTYNSSLGVATFRNNSGSSFTLTGFTTGSTVPTFDQVVGAGSATTKDIKVNSLTNKIFKSLDDTGIEFRKNDGGEAFEFIFNNPSGSKATFSLEMLNEVRTYFLPDSDGVLALTVNGITPEQNGNITLPLQDTFLTGGTYNSSTGVATFRSNSGNTFNVTGFNTGNTEVFATGATFSNNLLTIRNNIGNAFNTLVSSFTGLTNTGTSNLNNIVATGMSFTNLTGATLSATTVRPLTLNSVTINNTGTANLNNIVSTALTATTLYGNGSNLTGIPNTFVTGGTYSAGVATFRNNLNATFTVTGFSTGGTATTLSGDVTGNTSATVIGAGKVTNAMLAGSIADSKINSAVTWHSKANKYATIVQVTGTTYTVVGNDMGSVIRCSNASGCTVTINSALGEGFNCLIYQAGAFPVDIVAAVGGAILKKSSVYATTNGQHSVATVLEVDGNSNYLINGDLEQIP